MSCPTLLSWSAGENMWKRRAAILSQNRFKQDTDLAFLYGCIKPSVSSNEALLSGLSKREALKNIDGHRKKNRSGR